MMLLDFYTRLRRRKLISGSTYNLPMTQAQIGDYLGVTVVHVNRVLRSLSNDRIVRLEKHCVTILNLERLATVSRNGDITTSAERRGPSALSRAADDLPEPRGEAVSQ
jgi:hypothetical protein